MDDGGRSPRPITPLPDVGLSDEMLAAEPLVGAWEHRGQQWVITNDVIPRRCTATYFWPMSWPARPQHERNAGEGASDDDDTAADVEDLLRAFGFGLSDPVDAQIGEPAGPSFSLLFRRASLPPGWAKVPDPRLPSEIQVVDGRGLLRAQIAAKCTPYEVQAVMHFVNVYHQIADDLAAGDDTPWHLLTSDEQADVATALAPRGDRILQQVHDHLRSRSAGPVKAAAARSLIDALDGVAARSDPASQ